MKITSNYHFSTINNYKIEKKLNFGERADYSSTNLPDTYTNFSNNDATDDDNFVDSFTIYFDSIKGTKLLTKEEEQSLFKQYRQGGEEGEKARQKLIESNLKLVFNIAKLQKCAYLPFLDRIQEGNLGLMHAIEKFDYTRDTKFSTYATHWIKQYIQCANLNKSATVRLPVNKRQLVYKIRDIIEQAKNTQDKTLSIAQIAKELGTSEQKISKLLQSAQPAESIDAPHVDAKGKKYTLGIMLADPNQGIDFPQIDRGFQQAIIENLLSKLTPKQRKIIIAYYGLRGRKPKSREELAQIHNTNVNCISSHIDNILNKLRDVYIPKESLIES